MDRNIEFVVYFMQHETSHLPYIRHYPVSVCKPFPNVAFVYHRCDKQLYVSLAAGIKKLFTAHKF